MSQFSAPDPYSLGAMPGSGNGPAIYDPDANRLQMAQNLAVARRGRGQSATSQQGMAGASPLQQATLKAKGMFMDQAQDLTDDEKQQYAKMRDDPAVSANQFNNLLMGRRRVAKAAGQEHDFNADPAPTGAGTGTMSIQQGTGPNAMSSGDFLAGQARVKAGMTKGETMTDIGPRQSGDFSAVPPDQMAAMQQEAGPSGFQVSGLNSADPAATSTDPVVKLVQSYQQRMDPDQYARFVQFAQSGATPQQLHAFGEQALNGQDRNNRQDEIRDDREAMQKERQQQNSVMKAKHQRFMDLHRQNQEMRKGNAGVNWEGDESQFTDQDAALKQQFKQYHQNEQELGGLSGELEKGFDQPGTLDRSYRAGPFVSGSLPGDGTGKTQQQPAAAAPQQQQPLHIPRPPAPGAPLPHDVAAHFLQVSGGDKETARQLAKDAGWGF